MPESPNRVLVHFTYSTQNRRRWLRDARMRAELYRYNAAVLKENVDSPSFLINVVEYQIQMLFALSILFALFEVIFFSKTVLALWII
jgi:hypothetical protein